MHSRAPASIAGQVTSSANHRQAKVVERGAGRNFSRSSPDESIQLSAIVGPVVSDIIKVTVVAVDPNIEWPARRQVQDRPDSHSAVTKRKLTMSAHDKSMAGMEQAKRSFPLEITSDERRRGVDHSVIDRPAQRVAGTQAIAIQAERHTIETAETTRLQRLDLGQLRTRSVLVDRGLCCPKSIGRIARR